MGFFDELGSFTSEQILAVIPEVSVGGADV
jgi:hypothetical protein